MVTIPAGPSTYTLSASGVTATNAGSRGGVTVYGVYVSGSNDSVINTGTLLGAQAGIALSGGFDSVTNQVGGYVHTSGAGGFNGVLFSPFAPTPGTLVNAGRIVAGPNGTAVVEGSGGSVTNLSTGTLSGSGIYIANGAGSVSNAGVILGSALYGGIALGDGGSVSNAAGGTIAALSGPYGILISGAAGTITNAGTISGGSAAPAISLPAGYANRLVWLPGGVVNGTVQGGNTPGGRAVTTLELGSAAGAGTLSGLGTQIIGMGSIVEDAGASWSLAGANTMAALSTLTVEGMLSNAGSLLNNGVIVLNSGSFEAGTIAGSGTIEFAGIGGQTLGLDSLGGTTIAGMAQGRTIDLHNTTVTDLALLPGNLLRLTLSNSGTLDLRLDPAQSFAGAYFHHAAAGADSLITESSLPCFAAGTRILTELGEVAVEALEVGLHVLTAGGVARPITWLGHRRVDCARHPAPRDVQPIRIAAGAFAPGVPRAALCLSPDHAISIDGRLIPVRYLENGTTIRQEAAGVITYWHVELATHDVLLAEGLACESYLDTGNRGAFANGEGPVEAAAEAALAVWAARACAPLVTTGPEVTAIRLALLDRAIALGFAPANDPAVRLRAGDAVLLPERTGGRHRFRLDGGVAALRLQSLSAVPAHAAPEGDDHRRLGLAVRAIRADGRPIPLDDARLGAGWHAREAGAGWRWTDGDACIAITGVRLLDIEIAFAAPAWIGPDRRHAA